MSPERDDLNSFLRDYRTYIEQQQAEGQSWYFDEKSEAPAARSREAAATPPAPAAKTPRGAPPAQPAQPAQRTQPNQPAPQAQQAQQFEAVCAAFVANTLALIARHKETAPEQGNIFSTSVEEPPALDRDAKTVALTELAAEVTPCRQCKLHEGRTQTVFGAGNADANVVLIGEAPGAEEDRQGLPFVGRSGQLLTEILKAIGFARDEVYICNILKCRPPGNRDPEADEVQACEPYLQRQLEIIEPRVILCLGRTAAHTLLGTRASLGQLRESVHFYAGIPVMATFHPAALLRNPHWKRPTWDDVRRLRALHDALASDR